MPRANHQPMLTQFLIDERKRFPSASGDFNGLILDVATACKTIAKSVAWGNLEDMHGHYEGGPTNVHGETQKKLDVFANNTFLRFNEASGTLAGMVSEELTEPYQIPEGCPRGKYLLLFDPLDGSSNIDVNAPVGTVFSILRSPDPTLRERRRWPTAPTRSSRVPRNCSGRAPWPPFPWCWPSASSAGAGACAPPPGTCSGSPPSPPS